MSVFPILLSPLFLFVCNSHISLLFGSSALTVENPYQMNLNKGCLRIRHRPQKRFNDTFYNSTMPVSITSPVDCYRWLPVTDWTFPHCFLLPASFACSGNITHCCCEGNEVNTPTVTVMIAGMMNVFWPPALQNKLWSVRKESPLVCYWYNSGMYRVFQKSEP